MSEPELAVFHSGNLPAHHTNPDTDNVVDWPVINGRPSMPMSGRFWVRHGDGSLTAHEDGMLVVGADGHPEWVERPG